MKSRREIDLERFVADLLPEFAKETDRGCVLIVAAMAEMQLQNMLIAKLVKISGNQDELFDVPYAPLRDFHSKIDFAYRLGLISEKLCRDLHILRKIRNVFAHHIFDCNFENEAVKNQLSELKKPKQFIWIRDIFTKVAKERDDNEFTLAFDTNNERAGFLVWSMLMYVELDSSERSTGQRIEAAEDTFFYEI